MIYTLIFCLKNIDSCQFMLAYRYTYTVHREDIFENKNIYLNTKIIINLFLKIFNSLIQISLDFGTN